MDNTLVQILDTLFLTTAKLNALTKELEVLKSGLPVTEVPPVV